MDSTATQCTKVLRYMERHGRISQWNATEQLRVLRLGARIYDLKHLGYPIQSEMVYKKDENGDRVKWKEYWLAREQ